MYVWFVNGFYSLLMTILESGNMLIMLLAHARASGDGSLISRHVGTIAI